MYNAKTKKLAIGIDYDDTITVHPNMFKDIINVFRKYGCDLYIVTARAQGDYSDNLKDYLDIVDGIIFSEATAKQDIAEIDIWIDDFPLAITHDWKEYYFTPGKKILSGKWVKK